jgi:pimeloyl-ACP methyl ester carboxylesterase
MARNTRQLLTTLNVTKAIIMGHSMGGMLAARFAATYTDFTERVIIYNPIGLTDVRWERPWTSTEDSYKRTMASTQDQLYQGFEANIQRYFPNAWKPEYEKYVRILYAPTLSADWPRLAMVRATYQGMLYLDPVVYDWGHIKCKALVIGGDKDGPDFPERAKHIADSIPNGNATLTLLPGLGHVPHLQAPDIFYPALLKFLKSDAPVSGAAR